MKGERTPRDLHEAFPKDYEPVLNTGHQRPRLGGLYLLIVALIGAALYFWS
jgi:hypothetical protein